MSFNEGLIAGVVAALLFVLKQIIPPLKLWLDTSEWELTFIFGLCQVAGVSMWALSCYAGVEIPAFDPACDFSGLLMGAIYPSFLAFLFNWAGGEGFDWAKRKIKAIRNG